MTESFIADAAATYSRRYHDMIEQACEAAVQGGKHGVRVVQRADGTATAAVDPTAPYGNVFYETRWE